MNKGETSLWAGVSDAARDGLSARDYKAGSFAQRVAHAGVDSGELAAADRSKPGIRRVWIRGVEIFSRAIHPQRHRGAVGEFVRGYEGRLAEIGLWLKRSCAARTRAHGG